MITRLTKPVIRRVTVGPRQAGIWTDRLPSAEFVVTITRDALLLREYRRRTTFALPWRRAYQSAAQLAADIVAANRLVRGRKRAKRSLLRRPA